jgi:hypothetical protein
MNVTIRPSSYDSIMGIGVVLLPNAAVVCVMVGAARCVAWVILEKGVQTLRGPARRRLS